MGGFFGTISKRNCVADLFYGTDYNSHLGTRRGGLATYNRKERKFTRSIHNLENSYFRTKFEAGLDRFADSESGIGIISDTDAHRTAATFLVNLDDNGNFVALRKVNVT